MLRFAWTLFIAALAVSAALILGTQGELPATVATHFDGNGRPNGWMPRDAYVFMMLAIAIGIPVMLAGLMAWLPRFAPGAINLPHRDHWLGARERPATLAALSVFGTLTATLTAAFIAGAHLLVVSANRATPPVLDNAVFVPLIVAFVLLTGTSVVWLWRRFRRP